MRAQKLQKRAAGRGLGTQDTAQAAQELAQAEQAWAEATPENAQECAGALLFAVADSLRLAGVDAEEALSAASRRFSEKLKQENQ